MAKKVFFSFSEGLDDLLDRLKTFIARMPYHRLAAMGRAVGMLIFFVDVRHRRIVRRNLAFVYPDWTTARVNEMSRRVFQNLGTTLMEICRMTCLSAEDILNSVHISGEAHLREALEYHKGVVLVSAHIGNWEVVPLFWPLYFKTPIVVVARELDNKLADHWVCSLRSRFGGEVIYKETAMPEMIGALRADKALAILIDQGTKSSLGVKIKFLNRYVTATSGAALLAMRCKSPVLPGFCIRNGDGTFTLHLDKPMFLKRTGDLRADLAENTQAMTDAIEAMVRQYPEQWFWVHKRWRKYYPYLYPEDIARRKARRAKKNKRLARERSTE